MSPEAQQHAAVENRAEREARERAEARNLRQRMVGTSRPQEKAGQMLDRGAGGRRAAEEATEQDRDGKLSQQLQMMKQTYTQEIAAEKKKFAQERLLLKQQREMEKMKSEIARLTRKTKELEADQVANERKGDDAIASLTVSHGEGGHSAPSRALVEEVAEAAGKEAAMVVEKELRQKPVEKELRQKALAVRLGGRGEQDEAQEARAAQEASAPARAASSSHVLCFSPGCHETRVVFHFRAGAEKARREQQQQQRERSSDRLREKAARENEARERAGRERVARVREPRQTEVRGKRVRNREGTSDRGEALKRVRKHVVQAVPVKTVVAVADAVGDGEGQGGHPALRATATPLVVAQALRDQEYGVSTEQLHSHEAAQAREQRKQAREDRGDTATARSQQGARSQQALRRHWDSLAAARSRKEDTEGAEMLPARAHGERAESRSGQREESRRRPHPDALPQSLEPHGLTQRQIDERDDVVGTKWNAENMPPSRHAADHERTRRGHRSEGEGERQGTRVAHGHRGQAARAGKAASKGKDSDPYRYLGHTNGGPSAKFAFSEGSHGTRAVDSKMIPRAKLDLSGTAPYWASAIPADMPQKQQELKGEDRLNDIPPELRKSFRQRMEDLVSGKAAQRKHDAGPLRQLADGIKAITSDSSHHSPLPASRSAQGSWKGACPCACLHEH